MNFIQAIKVCFERFSDFSGRSPRSEYWHFALFIFVGSVVAEIIDAALAGVPFWEYQLPYGPIGSYGPAGSIFLVVCLVPFIAVSVRRLHDIGMSGWWLLLAPTLIGTPYYFVWCMAISNEGKNKFGPDPLDGKNLKRRPKVGYYRAGFYIFYPTLITVLLAPFFYLGVPGLLSVPLPKFKEFNRDSLCWMFDNVPGLSSLEPLHNKARIAGGVRPLSCSQNKIDVTVTSVPKNEVSSSPLFIPAKKRLALVIGNAAYKVGPLTNSVRDARLISQTLRLYGFSVSAIEDVNRKATEKALGEFEEQLQEAGPDATALFYYSGHGFQHNGMNFIRPINAKIKNPWDIKDAAISFDEIMSTLSPVKTGVRIILFDACRDSPFKSFTKSSQRGLAKIGDIKGTIIGFATGPGLTAADGDDENSPYTEGLVKAIHKPDLPIELVFKEASKWVVGKTDGKQVPWYTSSLLANFYFHKD